MSTRSSIGSSLSPRDEEIREVVNDVLLARIEGKVVSDESIIESHRHLMPELADQLRNLRLIQQAERGKAPVSDEGLHIRCPHCQSNVEVVDDVTLSDLVCPSCGSHFGLVDDSPKTFAASDLETIGHFKLLDKLGVGAYGSVWSARDLELDRLVAVKIPRKNQLSVEDTELFVREARAAAQLSHPNIVRVHEVGRENDRVFIVSDFVHGLDLADWLSDQQPTPREAAELCATMADALQHAHEHGVIHRDLKPSNIMLDTSGDPHLMDFGLAKREAGEMTMTVEGKLLGTPAYMSPEQARVAAHDADARSDIYSLGVILFELLTGERPFRGSTRMLLHQVLVEDPPSPRKLNGRIPKDLETICLKCLEKAPDQRYQNAASLRDDLGRYLAGEPVLARPITKVARGWRWCKRKPIVAGLSATIACLLLTLSIAGPIIATYQAALRLDAEDAANRESIALGQANLAKEAAQAATQTAVDESERRRRQLYISDMSMAQQALKAAQISKVINLLEPHRPTAGEEDLRGFEWYYLWAGCQRSIMTPTFKGKRLEDVIYSRDGRTLISLDVMLGQVTYRDADTLAVLKTIAFNNTSTNGGKLSPDGKTVLLLNERRPPENRSFRLVNLVTGDERQLRYPSGELISLRGMKFSLDGKVLAIGNSLGSVALWNATTGQQTIELKGPDNSNAHDERITIATFSPDGKTLATGSRDQTAKLWDVATSKLLETIRTDPKNNPYTSTRSSVWAVEFSPDGKTLAIGTSGSRAVLLWNVVKGEWIRTMREHDRPVYRLAFSKDNRVLASGGETIRLWDVASGNLLDSLPSVDTVRPLSFSPDKLTLADSDEGGVRLWRLKERRNPRIHRLPDDYAVSAISPDFSTAAMGSDSGTIEVWNVATDAEVSECSHGAKVTGLTWVARRQIASAGMDGKINIWNVHTGDLLETLTHGEKLRSLAFSSRNNLLAAGSTDGTISIWDRSFESPRRKTIRSHVPDNDGQRLVFSPDGRLLASSTHYFVSQYADGQDRSNVKLWDPATGELLHTFPKTLAVSVAFSADSSLLALGASGGEVILWDIADKKEIQRLKGHKGYVYSICFAQDGKRLFSGDLRNVKIWDLSTNKIQFELETGGDGVRFLAVTPDSRTIFTAGLHDALKQWWAVSEEEIKQMRERRQEIQEQK